MGTLFVTLNRAQYCIEILPNHTSYNYSAWAAWLLRPDVTSALNVCGAAGVAAFSGAAGGCVPLQPFDADDRFDYSRALGRALEAGVFVTLYYGTTDTACNHVGGRRVAETLPWLGGAAFQAQPLQPLLVGDVATGQWKSSGGLTFMQVDNAGCVAAGVRLRCHVYCSQEL